jgi:hypothetical protein
VHYWLSSIEKNANRKNEKIKMKTQTLNKRRFIMNTLVQNFTKAMILCGIILVTAQMTKAQDIGDTIAQAQAADTPMIALAQVPHNQNDYAIQPAPEMRALPSIPQKEEMNKAKRNYEQVGNALGFLLPVLTMVGFVLIVL